MIKSSSEIIIIYQTRQIGFTKWISIVYKKNGLCEQSNFDNSFAFMLSLKNTSLLLSVIRLIVEEI